MLENQNRIRVRQGDLLNPFGTGWFANTTGYFYLQAVSLRLLGWNLFALRFPSALLGALGVAAVYLLARDTFGRLLCVGVAAWIFFQAVVNIGMNLNLLPVAGLPLPFISYGGSSLVTLLAAMGLVQSVRLRHRKLEF